MRCFLLLAVASCLRAADAFSACEPDELMRTLNVNGFPRTWTIDRDGVVRRERVLDSLR